MCGNRWENSADSLEIQLLMRCACMKNLQSASRLAMDGLVRNRTRTMSEYVNPHGGIGDIQILYKILQWNYKICCGNFSRRIRR